jgi:hypothetical protein
MNERIRELWDQAKLDPTNEDAHHLVEKFAELIVRECIDTVLDSSVEYTTRPQVAIEIKEHFGVEE